MKAMGFATDDLGLLDPDAPGLDGGETYRKSSAFAATQDMSPLCRDDAIFSVMPKDELIIQLIKIALGVAIGSYFLWWSLEVLQRLPPR